MKIQIHFGADLDGKRRLLRGWLWTLLSLSVAAGMTAVWAARQASASIPGLKEKEAGLLSHPSAQAARETPALGPPLQGLRKELEALAALGFAPGPGLDLVLAGLSGTLPADCRVLSLRYFAQEAGVKLVVESADPESLAALVAALDGHKEFAGAALSRQQRDASGRVRAFVTLNRSRH